MSFNKLDSFLTTQERFARRRRSGDDIDLDALIYSLGDQCVGLPPSENVFIQLIRDQRSISTLFLVDMSNSTEGWVGQSTKEAHDYLEHLFGTGNYTFVPNIELLPSRLTEIYRILIR